MAQKKVMGVEILDDIMPGLHLPDLCHGSTTDPMSLNS
jgi:hypothetical protein